MLAWLWRRADLWVELAQGSAHRRTGGDDDATSVFGMRGAGGVLFLLTESVGLDAALYYNRLQYGGDGHTTNIGLALGVSAFVF